MNVINFKTPITEEACCSFCNTPKSQAKKLISNNQEGLETRYICDKCIIQSTTLIKESNERIST